MESFENGLPGKLLFYSCVWQLSPAVFLSVYETAEYFLQVLSFETKATWGHKVTLECVIKEFAFSSSATALGYYWPLWHNSGQNYLLWLLFLLHLGVHINNYTHYNCALETQCNKTHQIGKFQIEVSVL